ncbi:neuroplastin-like [Phlebotomus papatasi]|uniref:neuroplastin-like n=1 Tax=Phlebotomus papatasi TaxID=29031 RepID=UPI002484070F|nr:neuroplastin-like [Phlebotomus papatasi]
MFKLYTILIILVVLITQRVESQNTTTTTITNATTPTTTIIVFNIYRPLVLSCNLTLPENGTQEVKWYKNGTAVEDLEDIQGRYRVIPEEQVFFIEQSHLEDHGEYTCQYNTTTWFLEKEFTAVANVAARLTKNTQMIEGENLWLHCRVTGTNPIISWILPDGKNTTITNSTDRVQLFEMDGVPNSALEILDIRLDERGTYTCVVNNLATELQGYPPAIAYGLVRVRSHLAPLWPVCGMAVEFFILFVVLYLYEKYRDPEDVDDDSVCDYMPAKSKSRKD